MKHPNANVAAAMIGPAVVLIWLANLVNLEIPNDVAVVVGGYVIVIALRIGRDGIRGAIRKIWKGAA
jgi:hypothetical protein